MRAFGRDLNKPLAHQYAAPPEGAPWFTAHNVIARKAGSEVPGQVIVVLAHKDSQSWIPSPGANDNAIGTVGALEVARALASYTPRHTLQFVWCNEEHTPWTSVTAAVNIKAAGLDVLAALNMDGIGVKAPENKGRLQNVTRTTTDEGDRLAGMMAKLNEQFKLGLEQCTVRDERPNDDDGSFINAGFPWAVCNTGSKPYGDPNYHSEGDTADKVDYVNAALTAKLTLAAVLYLDLNGRP
ncbi:MAG: M28 family metallopeptidase [Anaerolineae bacterium]